METRGFRRLLGSQGKARVIRCSRDLLFLLLISYMVGLYLQPVLLKKYSNERYVTFIDLLWCLLV